MSFFPPHWVGEHTFLSMIVLIGKEWNRENLNISEILFKVGLLYRIKKFFVYIMPEKPKQMEIHVELVHKHFWSLCLSNIFDPYCVYLMFRMILFVIVLTKYLDNWQIFVCSFHLLVSCRHSSYLFLSAKIYPCSSYLSDSFMIMKNTLHRTDGFPSYPLNPHELSHLSWNTFIIIKCTIQMIPALYIVITNG